MSSGGGYGNMGGGYGGGYMPQQSPYATGGFGGGSPFISQPFMPGFGGMGSPYARMGQYGPQMGAMSMGRMTADPSAGGNPGYASVAQPNAMAMQNAAPQASFNRPPMMGLMQRDTSGAPTPDSGVMQKSGQMAPTMGAQAGGQLGPEQLLPASMKPDPYAFQYQPVQSAQLPPNPTVSPSQWETGPSTLNPDSMRSLLMMMGGGSTQQIQNQADQYAQTYNQRYPNALGQFGGPAPYGTGGTYYGYHY